MSLSRTTRKPVVSDAVTTDIDEVRTPALDTEPQLCSSLAFLLLGPLLVADSALADAHRAPLPCLLRRTVLCVRVCTCSCNVSTV
jgi:hypothetical protein